VPTAQLAAIARAHGVPLSKAEEFWAEARKTYGDDFAAVVGTVKKMCRNWKKSREGRLSSD